MPTISIEENDATLLDLPTEVLEHIFGFLNLTSLMPLRRLCRQMNCLVNSYIQNMRSLRISYVASPEMPVTNDMLMGVFSCQSNKWWQLSRLEFDGSKVAIDPLSADVIGAIFKSCPSLTSLTVEADVANDELNKKVALIEKAGRLRYFRWFGSARNVKRFEEIVCLSSPSLVVAHLHTLPSIIMVSLRQLVLERWPPAASAPLDAAWSRMPCLESLIVYWGRRANAVRHLAALSSMCRRLNELMVIDSDLIDGDMTVFPRGRLRRLDLLYNYLVTDEGVDQLVASNPNLLSLGLSNVINVSERALLSIGKGCHLLEQLAICGCSKISNGAIQILVQARFSLQENLPENCLPLPWLTVYAAGTKIDMTKDWLNPTVLERARVRVMTTDQVLLVPLRTA